MWNRFFLVWKQAHFQQYSKKGWFTPFGMTFVIWLLFLHHDGCFTQSIIHTIKCVSHHTYVLTPKVLCLVALHYIWWFTSSSKYVSHHTYVLTPKEYGSHQNSTVTPKLWRFITFIERIHTRNKFIHTESEPYTAKKFTLNRFRPHTMATGRCNMTTTQMTWHTELPAQLFSKYDLYIIQFGTGSGGR